MTDEMLLTTDPSTNCENGTLSVLAHNRNYFINRQ